MVDVAQFLVNGLVFSSIVVLGSIGLSIVYGIADFANFAHGDTMTVGAYAALVVVDVVGRSGPELLGIPVGFYLGLLAGIAVAAAVAVATELVVYRPLDVDALSMLIASIGVAFVYRATVQAGFGEDFRSFGVERSGPLPAVQETLGVAVTERAVVIVLSAVVLVVGLHLLLQYTTLGRKMRATADNPDLAEACGVRTARVRVATWVIGAGLAGAGGVFLGLFNQLGPRMGFNLLLVVFAAVILGGIGSVYGAVAGGVVIGMVTQLVPLAADLGALLPLVPAGVGVPVDSSYGPAVAFVIMVAILLVRPRGIAGGSGS
ncbi:branched-chain amino acid ABC transporter permease [Halobacteriales archaeon SW_7_71_33]|nr:MAG: branched-chain amino acid ABC transporter permease [Halobacteriales archaeon SW_7_71_33]